MAGQLFNSRLIHFLMGSCVVNPLKKVFLTLFIFNCVWLCAQHNYKSPYSVGLKAGYSLHTLAGDLTKSQPGGNFIAGLWIQLKMNKKWAALTELLLLDKGIGTLTRKSPHWVNLHYFEIPVLFQYKIDKMYFEFGPGLGYLINRAEHLYGNLSPDLVNKYPFSRSELSFNVGIACALSEKWSLGLRFGHSLLPVRSAVPLVSCKSYNRLLAFNITRQLRKRSKKDL